MGARRIGHAPGHCPKDSVEHFGPRFLRPCAPEKCACNNYPRMASPLKKLCLNVSPEIYRMAKARQAELPMKSESDFLLSLLLHNCRFRAARPHTFSIPILNQRADLRAAALERIVQEFFEGLEPSENVSLEVAMSEMIVERLLRIPARAKAIKSGVKPSGRRQ